MSVTDEMLRGEKTTTMTAYLSKTAELEQHFCTVGQNCVFLAKTTDNLEELLKKAIYDSAEFKALPKRSQFFIKGFIQGNIYGASRLLEVPVAETTPAPGSLPTEAVELPPKWVLDLQPGAEWHKHENGGGWVAHTAFVESSANISGKAVVYGYATVYDRTRVYGSARIRENAELFGAAHVHGKAIIEGNAKVCDAAKVLGEAIVGGTAKVGGTCVVRGETLLIHGEFYDQTILATPEVESSSKSGEHRITIPPVAKVSGVF